MASGPSLGSLRRGFERLEPPTFRLPPGITESVDHREAADFVARRLREELNERVHRVVLYGSVARGEAGPGSDVDLVVVAEDKRQVREALGPILGAVMRRGGPVVSTMVFTPAEYARFPQHHTSFYRDVLEGETLVA